MNESIQNIPLFNLLIAFIPVLLVLGVFHKWSLRSGYASYAVLRMLLQLMLVGYFLAYIFEVAESWPVLIILGVMVFTSSWIALGAIQQQRKGFYVTALVSISLGGGLILLLITQWVLKLDPWFLPRYMIPLAGMIFASAMNSVSLTAERLVAETNKGMAFEDARGIALQAAMIPVINSLFAVGLVSLPGMMTGQILSGVSPMIAARYQVMVMCMLFASSGISAAVFLLMIEKKFAASNKTD